MRLIDADDLFDKVYEAFGDDIDGGMANLFMGWINEAPTITPQNEWVSVEDRLPTKSGEYFVYTTDENISTAEFDEDCGEFGFWKEYYQDGAYLHSEWIKADWITHWMPIPAPPGKDNNVPTKEQNEPLTLDELLTMDGEPVWIKRLEGLSVCDTGWALVEIPPKPNDRLYVWWPGCEVEDTPSKKGYGKTWLAYRRPPERQEDTNDCCG